MRKRKMRDSKTTRDRLLNETARLVERQGFGPTSVNDVLQAAGVKKGTLYYHFPGKDELGLAVLERARDDFLKFLDSALAAPTPMEALERFFKAALRKHRKTGFVGGCLWGNTALEMSDSSPAYTALVERVFEEWICRIERVIRSGQEAGQIRTDQPAAELARLVVAGIEGGIMMSRLTKLDSPLRSCLESLRLLLAPKTIPAASLPASSAEQEQDLNDQQISRPAKRKDRK
ncbi:MAG: TetR/AcrR family transcriptional regulator [Sedimentisphaerales bacterium]|nr:TetR/AcrR family transcriptional regulator [Sedimentisphaerales bacterium]